MLRGSGADTAFLQCQCSEAEAGILSSPQPGLYRETLLGQTGQTDKRWCCANCLSLHLALSQMEEKRCLCSLWQWWKVDYGGGERVGTVVLRHLLWHGRPMTHLGTQDMALGTCGWSHAKWLCSSLGKLLNVWRLQQQSIEHMWSPVQLHIHKARLVHSMQTESLREKTGPVFLWR